MKKALAPLTITQDKRDDTILNTMVTALGMTERQVDDLFIAAGKL